MTRVKSLNHIGIAVRSIDAQRSFYEDTLGAVFESLEEVPSQKVRVAFYRLENARFELLEPTDDNGPIAKFLDQRGEGLHHLAFTVDDIQARIAELKQSGFQMIDNQPRVGSHQMQVAFVHPNSAHGVLMELCEPT